MKKTFTPTKSTLEQKWHLIDAKDVILGKLAVKVSVLLMGKNKSIYTPNINTGDKIVIINAEKVAHTGAKGINKIYYRHTGFPGGLKSQTLDELTVKKPDQVIRNAVSGMLPKNKLRKVRMANLYIYKGEEHPHKAQLGK